MTQQSNAELTTQIEGLYERIYSLNKEIENLRGGYANLLVRLKTADKDLLLSKEGASLSLLKITELTGIIEKSAEIAKVAAETAKSEKLVGLIDKLYAQAEAVRNEAALLQKTT